MILVTSDTHCYYDTINQQIEYAETVLGHTITSVIHLGDFGAYKPHLNDYFIKQNRRFKRPLYFIDGNHEDFDSLDWIVRRYKDCFTYLPRGTVHKIDGYRFLALGGAAYMDSMITQRGAVITDAQIDKCLALTPEAVDILITHDCPVGIGVPNTPGLDFFGETGFPRSNELAAHFRPRLWLFGHHHQFFSHVDRNTRYYGLSGTWKGFGLLDTDYDFRFVEHNIAWTSPPFLEKLLVKLKLIRPDTPQYR